MAESATYRGYPLIIDDKDVLVVAPDGDVACFYSMARVRKWVRRKQALLDAHQRPEERARGGDDG